jgi:molecular chaperone GrpE
MPTKKEHSDDANGAKKDTTKPKASTAASQETEETQGEEMVNRERYLRALADLANLRTRIMREREEWTPTVKKKLLLPLLPILDDFDRAIAASKEDNPLYEGITLVRKNMHDVLKAQGLHTLATQVGDAFDSEQHEALSQLPAPEESLKGKITAIVTPGYRLNDQIIRVANVIIGL